MATFLEQSTPKDLPTIISHLESGLTEGDAPDNYAELLELLVVYTSDMVGSQHLAREQQQYWKTRGIELLDKFVLLQETAAASATGPSAAAIVVATNACVTPLRARLESLLSS
jgi:cobalamin biosynthesis Mg chelatase CobN